MRGPRLGRRAHPSQKRPLPFPGGHGEDETPVPIPNTEVKGLIGEGTAGFARGRVARRRDFPEGPRASARGPSFFFRPNAPGPRPAETKTSSSARTQKPICSGLRNAAPRHGTRRGALYEMYLWSLAWGCVWWHGCRRRCGDGQRRGGRLQVKWVKGSGKTEKSFMGGESFLGFGCGRWR